MNTRRLVAVVLSLLAVLAGNHAAAQPLDPIWREVNQVSFGDVHRRPPGAAQMPPPSAAEVARWRAEMAGSVRAVPTDTFWQSVKAGGTQIVRNPLSLAKGGARLIGTGALFQIGALGVNAALKAFYDQAKADGSGTNSGLYLCMSNSVATGGNTDMTAACETRSTTTTLGFPHGTYPAEGQTNWWWDYTMPDGTRYYFLVQGTGAGVPYYYASKCAGQFTNSGQVESSTVEQAYQSYVDNCIPPRRVTSSPVDLTCYVDGCRIGDATIPPRPAVKQEIKDAVTAYIERTPPVPRANGEVYPGMTLSPPPSASGWYGVPVRCTDDEDGDNWSDCEEILRGSDPNIATSVPDPNRDTDGDGAKDPDEDRLGTDPYDPASTPEKEKFTDTDGDGLYDIDDPDDDNDLVPDVDEIAAGSNPKDATSKPVDTDGDGKYDYLDPDDDNDNVPDVNDPEPLNKNVPQQCAPGTVASQDGKSCVPQENPANCPDGMKSDGMTPPKCVPDTDPKDPVGDECGNFSIKRLTTHTGHYLRDLVMPCRDLADMIAPITTLLKSKFPFSLASSLNGWFDAVPAGEGSASQLPDSIGPIPTDWGWLAPLWAVIKNIVGVGLWAWFVYWLIDRFTPQAVM